MHLAIISDIQCTEKPYVPPTDFLLKLGNLGWGVPPKSPAFFAKINMVLCSPIENGIVFRQISDPPINKINGLQFWLRSIPKTTGVTMAFI